MELTNEFRVRVPVEDAWKVLTDVERIAPCLPGAQLQEIEGDEFRGVVKVKVGPITAQYKGKATFKSRDDVEHVAVLKAEGRDTRGQGNASALITATLTADGDGTAVKVETNLTITGKVAQFGRGVLVDVSGKLLTQFVECLEHDLLSGVPSASNGSATPPHGDPVAPAATTPSPAPEPEPKPKKAEPKKPARKKPEPAVAAATTTPTATATATKTTTPEPEPESEPEPEPEPVATIGVTDPPTEATEARVEDPPTIRRIDHNASEPVDLLDAAGVPVAKRAIPVVAGVLVIVWFLRRRRRNKRR
ncbi:MAG TPA: SRPBCC family protein [Acidimicrobiales bacterium]|nr:SRPBCC family protein [Acidimicrobiales bacterium]